MSSHNASVTGNGSRKPKTFKKFFECWIVEQNRYLQQLISASEDYQNAVHNTITNGSSSSTTTTPTAAPTTRFDIEERLLRPLVRRVLEHYEHYYRAKSRWAKLDVLAMLTPSWRSSLEDAFLWIGGWRPSMAFHLLYSKLGLQLDEHLLEVIHGLSTGDLGDLSPSQLTRIDELHRTTLREEKQITDKMAKRQETVADTSMVELSHVVSEMMRDGGDPAATQGEEERVETTLATKEKALDEVLQKADDLRLATMKGVVEILTRIQAVHFLIAAAELHLRLHDWGKQKDAREHLGGGSP